MTDPAQSFAEVLATLEDELDWRLLGENYCHDGGELFFPPEQIEAQRDAGLVIAGALGEELAQLPERLGRSLYVGAGVAELVPILAESLVLGREVVILNLEGPEPRELNRALAATEERCDVSLPRIQWCEVETLAGEFDHGWLVSVINDPEAFPALHDVLYERQTEGAPGPGELEENSARATVLVRALLAKLSRNALLSTTDEELPFLAPLLAEANCTATIVKGTFLTPIVGDPLRFVWLAGAADPESPPD